MLFGALVFGVVWCLIALFLRSYPETMAGYNTMPKKKRARIDIALLSPLMPSKELYVLMLVGVPAGLLIGVAIYVNVCKKKFEK